MKRRQLLGMLAAAPAAPLVKLLPESRALRGSVTGRHVVVDPGRYTVRLLNMSPVFNSSGRLVGMSCQFETVTSEGLMRQMRILGGAAVEVIEEKP